MKLDRRCQRILILSLLSVSVFAPIVLVSNRLKNFTSTGGKEFIDDLSSYNHRTEALKLNAVHQEAEKGVKEPTLVVYEDEDFNSVVSFSSSDGNSESAESRESRGRVFLERSGTGTEEIKQIDQNNISSMTGEKLEHFNQTTVWPAQNVKRSQPLRVTDAKIKEIKDQVIRAKAYLNFAPPNSNSHLVKELKLRIKELERAVGAATKDSDLSRSALQRMRSMEASLSKANRVYPDCSAMATKLRAMTYNAEEQVQSQKNQATFLIQLAARTTPKSHHCLSMKLTSEYFAVQPEERDLPITNHHKLHDPSLYHYAIFSDNVLACAVLVNSVVSSALQPEKVVFHVVTDSLNLPAISMWFTLNPPSNSTIQIQSRDKLERLSTKYGSAFEQTQNSSDPRYSSALNHLRFYLPEIFPLLNKIVLLDHDVVVQKDLTALWSIDMKGKANGAVETCKKGHPSYRSMDMLINFSDPMVAKRFDLKACTWAFGLNLFDLREWRRRNLTALYLNYLQLGYKRQLWKAGSLPLGWVTFYNQTVALDRRWHVLGLGYESGLGREDIERAAVIHYDGVMKPWLDIGIEKYKGYWSKHVNYEHPYLQQCNIHQ